MHAYFLQDAGDNSLNTEKHFKVIIGKTSRKRTKTKHLHLSSLKILQFKVLQHATNHTVDILKNYIFYQLFHKENTKAFRFK